MSRINLTFGDIVSLTLTERLDAIVNAASIHLEQCGQWRQYKVIDNRITFPEYYRNLPPSQRKENYERMMKKKGDRS